ncbi:hypothetical protein ACE3NQ_20560 [Paenibacillus terreus]|uniref:Uncharacterized protein n=1 Tax=Paenibacillus terreus TaxID=1387834 RepID=A0ABV5BC77_9BACL
MDEKIIERFKYVMGEDTPVFNSYVIRKAKGEILDIDFLPPDDLQEMFIDEIIIDNILADLFDVKKEIVTKKRYKHGIKQGQTFSKKLIQKLEETINNSFQVIEKTQSIDHVLIPIKIIFRAEDDLILVPYRVFENDGRSFPFYDYEGLQEIDIEAFCIRISKVKKQIGDLLSEIIDFLVEYEWEGEISFENKDEKVIITAVLYTEEDSENDKASVSLTVSLQISGQHLLGDIIFESEYDLQKGILKISTDDSDFELDEDEMQGIFEDCWDGLNRYVQVQKEMEAEIAAELEDQN